MTDPTAPTTVIVGDIPALDILLDAFWAYESALMLNDLARLDALFVDSPHTVRADARGIVRGHAEISAFRSTRTVPPPPRRVTSLDVHGAGADAAVIMAGTHLLDGGTGVQTQLWVRTEGAWRISAAHVSVTPA